MNTVLQDVRFAARMLWRAPVFAVSAILALALGIAVNAAVFSLMDALLLRPFPGTHAPQELVVFERWQAGKLLGDLGYPDFQDYRGRLKSFSGVAAEASARVSYSGRGETQRVVAALVSGNYFAVLGALPAAGRLLMPSDEIAGGRHVAVVSDAFRRRVFGDDPVVIGSDVRVNGSPFTVVGVAADGLGGTYEQFHPDLWVPITEQPVAMPRMTAGTLNNRASGWLRVFARLKPGTPLGTAQAELTAVAASLAHAYPATNHTRTVRLVPGLGMDSDDRTETSGLLGWLLACVALLQMMACANVANLLLARAESRRREVAVRVALGAGRARLVRLFLVEGALLSGGAGTLGIVLAPALARAAVSLNPDAYLLRGVDVRLDPLVTAFVLGLAVASGLLFSLAPALRAARVDLNASLKDGSPGAGRSRSRLRGVLIAAQIAVSLVLLAGAGTGIVTMRRALSASPIARPEGLMLGSLDLDTQGYSAEKAQRFWQALLPQLRVVPGVESASLGGSIPPEEFTGRRAVFRAGEEPPPGNFPGHEFEYAVRPDTDVIGPGFFHTLGMPLLAGREFSERDRADSLRVGIVNERLAQRLWPGRSAIGERIAAPEFSGVARPPVTIVGIVRDAAVRSLVDGVTMQLYLPIAQEGEGRATLIVRGNAGASAVRAEVTKLDPAVPLFAVKTMPEHIAAALWRQRIAAGLLGLLGMLAVVLAAMGVYGVAAHAVAQRTREIGIRIAIGARGEQVSAMVIRDGLGWIAVGAAAGLPVAWWATLAMRKSLPGARPLDLAVLAGTLALLAVTSWIASYIPARRAARVDPMIALRQ